MEGQDITVKVGLIKPIEAKKDTLKEVKKKAGSVIVTESVKHSGKSAVKEVVKSGPRPGTITIIALDANGNEKGNEFSVPEKEYRKYYSDEKKFKFKKKAI